MLHLGMQPLYCLLPTRPDDRSILRAWGRLVAEAIDSVVGLDGTQAMQRKHAFGPLREAIATLVAAKASVRLVRPCRKALPGLHKDGDAWTVSVRGEWTEMCLADASRRRKRTRYGGADEMPRHEEEDEEGGYDLVVRGLAAPASMVALSGAAWGWVVRTETLAVRVAMQRRTHDEAHYEVLLYRCGILWDHEMRVTAERPELHGARLLIDVTTTSDDVLPEFPSRMDPHGARVMGHALLRADFARDWSRSALVRRLAARARPWRHLLREEWCGTKGTQDMVDALCDTEVCDELTALMDARVLLRHAGRDARLDMIGLSVLRRMQPRGCSRSADWCASSVAEHSVAHFAKIPVTCARLERLHALGAMEAMECPCRYGVLQGHGEERLVIVPMDADASAVTLAVASLLSCDVPLDEEAPETWTLGFGALLSESASAPDPREMLHGYRVRLDVEEGVVLTRDASLAPRRADEAISLDVLDASSIARNPARTRREELGTVFPRLVRRLELQSDAAACVREAQARRVVTEWTLEAIDTGGNLSSLGMSVLVALALGDWFGARMRVYVGRARAAVVGVWDKESFLLVDPSRTTLNAFDVAPSMVKLPEGGYTLDVRRGVMVEVRAKQMWHVAKVLDVFPQAETATVQFFLTGRRIQIALRSHSWRRLAKSDDTDIDRVMRMLSGSQASHVPPASEMPVPPLPTIDWVMPLPQEPIFDQPLRAQSES